MLTQFSITGNGKKFISTLTKCSPFEYDNGLQCAVFTFYIGKQIEACIPMSENQYVTYLLDATRVICKRMKHLIVDDKCYTRRYYEAHAKELQAERSVCTDDSICEQKLNESGIICRREVDVNE